MQSIKKGFLFTTFRHFFTKKDIVLAKRKPRENLKVCEIMRTKKEI